MKNKISRYAVMCFMVVALCYCNSEAQKEQPVEQHRVSYIDTFNLKYEAEISGRKKEVNRFMFIGAVRPYIKISNIEYQRFIFGDSINPIALIRKDSNSLNYINATDKNTNKNLQEKVLLYFNKRPMYRWNVNIDSSFFWKREITFVGIKETKDGSVYVFDVAADSTHSDIGDHVSKLFYSKEKGFVKFVLETHWFPVEVNKIGKH